MLMPPSESAQAGTLAQALLTPLSVAIVGQSDDAGKTAGRPLKFLRQAGYAGRVYPINARRDTVLGERAWPSLAALPEVPEHAYVVTGTEAAVEAVRQWRYEPASGAAINVERETDITVSFISDEVIAVSFPESAPVSR